MSVFVIEHKTAWGFGEPRWEQMRGRRYLTESKAVEVFDAMERFHDECCASGRIHPSWAGKFQRDHRVRERESDGCATIRVVKGGAQ